MSSCNILIQCNVCKYLTNILLYILLLFTLWISLKWSIAFAATFQWFFLLEKWQVQYYLCWSYRASQKTWYLPCLAHSWLFQKVGSKLNHIFFKVFLSAMTCHFSCQNWSYTFGDMGRFSKICVKLFVHKYAEQYNRKCQIANSKMRQMFQTVLCNARVNSYD